MNDEAMQLGKTAWRFISDAVDYAGAPAVYSRKRVVAAEKGARDAIDRLVAMAQGAEKLDSLRTTLEVIALGDAHNPQLQAAEELIALGYWRDTPEAREAIGRIPGMKQAPQEPAPKWTSVAEGMPASGAQVLACYTNGSGKERRIRAMWIAAKAEPADIEQKFSEYDEATDTYYTPPGWYECIDNWGDYSSVFVCEGEVSLWMDLPPLPTPPKG